MTSAEFTKIIWEYYRQNGRKFEWRETKDEYRITVSEVMLQQTQTARVVGKYREFIQRFPDWTSLSQADLSEVLLLWSGLGYNRRGRYLWELSKTIVDKYKGQLPRNQKEMDALPGIGPATAASILVFSQNAPLVFIETNIRRVFLSFFFGGKEKVEDKDIVHLIEETMDKSHAREWYYALMDYGAMLGKSGANANRKSAHYTTQSKFEGSRRQLRGRITRLVLKEKTVSLKRIVSVTGAKREIVNEAINGLIQDKLVIMDGDIVRIIA